ncbi:MAG: trehalose-phosphatase [Acidobacteria bacterium]|nr:trehalose-phosphatase [Acidobacteriota bacterium]
MQARSTFALPSALDPAHAARWLRLADGEGVVFLDYDGTLTPIVARPELATLSAGMRESIGRLAARLPVAIVSGRDVAVVAELVGIDGPAYVGSHGLDITGFGGGEPRREVAREFVPQLDAAEGELRRATAGIAGVLVERKRFSVATHVRLAASGERGRVEEIVEQVGRAHPSLRRERGKMVFELRPDIDWDKGRAVCWLLDAMGRERSSALFIGDDLTDETAFRALAGRGLGIVVSETDRDTAADLRVANPSEVLTLLGRLADAAETAAS